MHYIVILYYITSYIYFTTFFIYSLFKGSNDKVNWRGLGWSSTIQVLFYSDLHFLRLF